MYLKLTKNKVLFIPDAVTVLLKYSIHVVIQKCNNILPYKNSLGFTVNT